jgi:hypothetical protein
MNKEAKKDFLSKIRDAVILDRNHQVAIGEIKEFVVKHKLTLDSFVAMNGIIKTQIIYAICTPEEILGSSKDSEKRKRMMGKVRVSFKRLKDCLFPTSSVVQPEVALSATNTGSSPTTMGAAQVAKMVTSSATTAGGSSAPREHRGAGDPDIEAMQYRRVPTPQQMGQPGSVLSKSAGDDSEEVLILILILILIIILIIILILILILLILFLFLFLIIILIIILHTISSKKPGRWGQGVCAT